MYNSSAPAFPLRARPLAPRQGSNSWRSDDSKARMDAISFSPPLPLLSRQFTCSGFLLGLGPQICSRDPVPMTDR